MKKYFTLLLLLVLSFSFAQETKPDFWNDIENFKAKDKENPPPSNAILLLGSSSFTLWQDVGDYFPGKTFINKGFGGSRLADLLYYSPYLLSMPTPKQVLIYCGENDVAHDKEPADAKEVVRRYKAFFNQVRNAYPEAQIDYLAMKHSPSRDHLWPEMNKGNRKIKKFMNRQKNAEYIDINKVLEDEKGNIRKDLFLEDMLHLNPEGYRLWSTVILPYLK